MPIAPFTWGTGSTLGINAYADPLIYLRLSERQSALVRPLLMSQGRLIQLVPIQTPLRHKLIHQCSEVVVMVAFQQMNHLVDQYILKTLGWFLGKLQV